MTHEGFYTGQDGPPRIIIDQRYIDENGHVHFKNFPEIFEEARSQWMREREIRGRVTEMDIEYKSSVYAGDAAYFMTPSQVNNLLTFDQQISQGGKTTTESHLTLALLSEGELPDEKENINYKEYPKIFEDARIAFMKKRGVSLAELANDGLYGLITTMNLKYAWQLQRGKDMSITTNVFYTGVRVIFDQEVTNSGIQSHLEMILIDSKGKPQRIPQALAQNLSVKH